MPAMPIALSNAPIVVGIRQTSRATSTIVDGRSPAYADIGASVATASKKMMVSEDSRIDSATSFGVLRRDEPFDQRDHLVQEGLSRRRGDLDGDLVGQHAWCRR